MDVVVVGSINVDLVVRVAALPVPGETVIGRDLAEAPGGKGANAAAAAAALGARTTLVGAVGDDERGRAMRTRLIADGVDVRAVAVVDDPTGVALIAVDDAGENAIVVAPGANRAVDPAGAMAAVEGLPASGSAVLANLEAPLPVVIAAAAASQSRDVPFVLNPAPARRLPPELVATCAVIIPNGVEAPVVHGDGAAGLLADGAGAVVVTRGGDGCELHTAAGVERIPAVPADVVDTTGAGDAFCACLTVALAAGHDLRRAAELAVRAGARAVATPGARATLPRLEQL